MSTKRTVINADEELVIKGKLTIEGNVTQIETTQQVTNLEGNVFTINSDGSNTSAVLILNSNGTVASFTFDSANGSIVVNKPINFGSQNITTTGNVTASYFIGSGSALTGITTSIVSEGTNLYFTSARVRGNINVIDAGGDGAIYYSSANGNITYVGPSSTEVRAHFSATNGVEYSNSTGVINLASSTAGNGLTYTTGVLAVGAGDGITVNADNVAVNNTVIRTTGDQTITGNTTFVGTTSINGNIVPTTANTGFIGTPSVHIGEIWANLVHAERLDLGDANISDIHARFFAGNVAGPYITTNSSSGLTYTHNASAAGYEVNAGDGLQISGANVAVDSTVVRTSGSQSIAGEKTFTDDVAIQGNLDVTGNINSRDQVDLYVTDTKITLANSSPSNVDAYIYVDGNYTNNPYIKWDYASSSWKFSNNGTTTFSLPTSTTDLNEGTNLYFTTGRVNTAIDAYIIGGNGVTYSSGTIAVGAGDGINVNADNVAVDSSVVRTTSNQSISGVKTFTGELVLPSITSATANNSIFVNPSSNSCFIIINGNPVQLTADSDVGQVEDVGSTGINIYAGFRSVPIDNVDIIYHGIKSIDDGTYTTLTESSNVITVDGNISAIRGAFSAANIAGYGGIGYDSANGVFNYSGVTDAQIRGLFSGSGLITYNSANGSITTSADNYSSWTVQTDSGAGAAEAITSGEKLTIQSGTGITVTNTGNVITITNSSTADITGVSAGNGLVGGGNSGDVTLNIGAGSGITVNADNVAVDSTVIRTSGSQTIDLGSTDGTYLTLTGNAAGRQGLMLKSTQGDLDSPNLIFSKYRGSSGANNGDSLGAIEFHSANDTLGAIAVHKVSNTSSNVLFFVGETYLLGEVQTQNIALELTANKAVKVSNSYTLPTTDGTNGQKLTTYGNGTVYWSTESADITEVVAGSGLTGGGSSGAVTLNIGAGDGITVNADNVSLASTTAGSGLTFTSGILAVGAGDGITVNADNVALTSGIITTGAKTYGTASAVPAITVDTYGRVTSISNTSISITASQVSDFTSAANTAIDARVSGGNGLTYSGGILAVGAGSYITVAADTVSVDASTTNTAGKVVARDGAGNVYANYFVGTATAAQYADLAENYLADSDYLPGTVLVFGGDAEVTAATTYDSTRVAGVVTTQPAHVMNSHLVGPNVTCIALRGRVPVKVKGVVRKGDVLVTAGEGFVGYAVAALYPRDVPAASMVGKAITDKLDNGPGVVEALI